LLSIAWKWSLPQLRLNGPATASANENDLVANAETPTPWRRLLVSQALPPL
jgi:hypothetical protein